MTIRTKDRTGADLNIASSTVGGEEVPVNQLANAAGATISPATESTLAALSAKVPALGQAAMAASLPVVLASNQGAVPVSGTFWQATQPVSFTWSGLTDAQLRASAVPVSGPLTDAQLRATAVPVSGTFWQATQPVSFTWAGLTDAQLRASNVPVTLAALTYPVSTNNSSSAQLAAGASFTGTIETIQNQQAAQISIVCDQPYTVQVQQFIDAAGTQALPVDTFTRAAGQPFNENITLPGDYFRLVVTNNGGSTTTTLRIGTTFGIMSTQPRALTNEGRFPVDAAPPAALLSSYTQAGVITINTVLLALDCSQHRSVSVQCTSMGTAGVVTPEWSNDNATWVAATMFTAAGASALTFNAAGLWTLPVAARYLRLRLSTATTAGTTTLSVHRFDDGVQPWLATQPVSGTVTANIGTGALAAGTNAIGDFGVQYRTSVTGAASFVSVLSPATPAAATIKATAGRLIGWQLHNGSAGVRSVKIFNVAAPTLGTTGASFEIDIAAGGRSEIKLEGGIAFSTAMTYSVTSAKGLTDNTSTGLAANDVSGAFFFA